jgi:hypothetical protein
MKLPTPLQSLSLLGVAAVVLAIPLFVIGLVISRLSNDPEPKKFTDYLLIPPAD